MSCLTGKPYLSGWPVSLLRLIVRIVTEVITDQFLLSPNASHGISIAFKSSIANCMLVHDALNTFVSSAGWYAVSY